MSKKRIYYIDYEGEKLPFKFSHRAIQEFQEKYNESDIEKINDIAFYKPVLKLGLKYGYKADNKEFSMTDDQIDDLLDDIFYEMPEILNNFFLQMGVKKME